MTKSFTFLESAETEIRIRLNCRHRRVPGSRNRGKMRRERRMLQPAGAFPMQVQSGIRGRRRGPMSR